MSATNLVGILASNANNNLNNNNNNDNLNNNNVQVKSGRGGIRDFMSNIKFWNFEILQ